MPAEWSDVTWADVETGDFVRHASQIFRVDACELKDADSIAVTLYRPAGTQHGFLHRYKPIQIRTRDTDNNRTPAGQRLDPTARAAALLREQLGAELVGLEFAGDPFLCAGQYSAPELASHLQLFHGLYTGGAKSADGPELRAAHKAFHAAAPTTETGRRHPHVHNDEAFQKGKP